MHVGVCTPALLQLTDVDPPYGKAPTAQLAEKLPETGRAGEVFENTREMLLETQVGVGVATTGGSLAAGLGVGVAWCCPSAVLAQDACAVTRVVSCAQPIVLHST